MIPVSFRTHIDCLKRLVLKLPSTLYTRPITGDYVMVDQRIATVVAECVFDGMNLEVWLDIPDYWKGDIRLFEKHVKGDKNV